MASDDHRIFSEYNYFDTTPEFDCDLLRFFELRFFFAFAGDFDFDFLAFNSHAHIQSKKRAIYILS